MHVIVTGYKNPNAKMRNGDYFVDIRIVAIPDQTDDPKVKSGNTDSLISSLNRLITERCGDVLDEYNININNVIQEPRTDKRPSALRISLAESLAQDFLKDEFWANPIGRLLSKKCYKDEAGNKFGGFTKEPYNILKASDVFVLPTHREGFGVSVIEASCAGLPVITSNVYGVVDASINGVTGIQCPVNNPEAFQAAMKKLYEDDVLRKKMGENGRQRILREFRSDIVANAWLDFYHKILNNK